MTIKLPFSPNQARIAILIFFGITVWIGAELAAHFGAEYLAIFVGAVTVSVALQVYFGWILIGLKCLRCKGTATLEYKYCDGPAGTKNYLVASCTDCKGTEVI